MATNNPRIRYDIEAGVTGEQDVNALARELDKLAETLEGDLKTQAQASAQALRELGAKQGAIDNFVKLKTEAGEASKRLREAQAAAQDMGRAIAATGTPTRTQAVQMDKLRDAVRQAKEQYQQSISAIDRARSSMREYGLSTTGLAEQQRRVSEQVRRTRVEVIQMTPAYTAAGQAAAQSGAQQQRAAETATTAVQKLGNQLRSVQNIAMAAVGGTFITHLAGDVAATADEFKNLEARVKLATGEGENFDRSFAGVQRVALATNSALDETGTLFARLTKASEEGGMAAEAAQQRALGLTETINQSIQLSGGSADSAKAAITQLIQGLQSGVLRGEEFNSVMEQAPRLAQAMANGLGVTTGQLRELAKEGKLTAEVVMQALEGQADAVATEFGKLPETVGRALQNLSSAWTLYVGESDRGLISSENAAKAINALAENLDTLVSTLETAGKIWAAMKIAQMAVHFADWARQTIAATAATIDNTGAVKLNTKAHWDNAAAAKASAAAQGQAAAASTGATAQMGRGAGAAVGAAGALGKLGSAARSTAGALAKPHGALTALRGALGLVGRGISGFIGLLGGPAGAAVSVVLFWKEIKTLGGWLGETAAKMAGYRDLSKEIALADEVAAVAAKKVADERQRQAEEEKKVKQEASDRAKSLTDDAKAMVAEYQKLRKEGKDTADALAEVAKNGDLGSAVGTREFGAALRELKLDAEGLRTAFGVALKDGDLEGFAARAKAAFGSAKEDAGLLASALDAGLREAVRQSGADFDVLAGGMSEASKKAIASTDTIIDGMGQLKSQGVDVGKALEASLGKAIDTADSQAAVDALADRIESVQDVLGRRQANNLLTDLRQQAEKAGLDVDKLPERFTRVGAASDEARAKVVALREEYQKAVDAGDWQRASEIQEKLRDETGASAEKSKELATALKDLGVTSDAELKKAATAARNLYEQVRVTGGSAREQADAFQKMADAAIRSGDSTAMAYAKSQAAAHGFEIAVDKAGKTVVRRMGEAAKATQDYSSSINKATQEVQEHIGWLDRMAERNAEVKSSMKMDGQGFAADESGNRIAMGGDLNTLTGIAAFLKSAGIDDDATARRIAMEFSDGKGNIPYFSNPGQKRYGGDTISMALLRAAERVTFGASPVGGANVPGVPTSVPKQGARDVNFNLSLNGESYGTVDTSEQGQAVMNRFLDELQRGKMRSTRR